MAVQVQGGGALVPSFRSCHTADGTPKKRYANWLVAREVALLMEERFGEPMVGYACPVCQRWHVGHVRAA